MLLSSSALRWLLKRRTEERGVLGVMIGSCEEYFDRPDLSKSCFYDFHVEYSIEADIGGRLQSAERHWLGWTKQTQRAAFWR